MARPLPVNLLMAGTGAVLLVSGISGEPLGEVLKGQFGDITGKQQAAEAADTEASGGGASVENVSDTENGAPGSGVATSPSTFASSPTSFSKEAPTKQQQAQGIAAILLREGITNPTNRQIELARIKYEQQSGVQQFEGGQTQEFSHGLPLV
jgi:hypothetical protein